MSMAEQLLSAARAYAQARGISESRLSTLLFQDGKRLRSVREGADISIRLAEHAIDWLAKNWPENVSPMAKDAGARAANTWEGDTMSAAALQLVDELRTAGRISTVEAGALRGALADVENERSARQRLLPSAFDGESLRKWVRQVCSTLDVDPTSLARLAGLNSCTLNDFLKSEGERGFNSNSIEAIIQVCRSSPVETLRTIADLFDRFHGSAALGRAIGKGQSTASEMKRRGSIPIEHWPALIAAAREIGLDLDEATLVRLHLAAPARETAL